MNKPIVGITMGDPAGSGPEITIKALADPEQYSFDAFNPLRSRDRRVLRPGWRPSGRTIP